MPLFGQGRCRRPQPAPGTSPTRAFGAAARDLDRDRRRWRGSGKARSCVESLPGVEGGQEGVKLEAQVPITEGVEILSGYPMDEEWL